MFLFQAKVLVRLRSSVLDPAGEASKSACGRLGIKGVKSLRIGKAIDVQIEALDEHHAREQIELMSDRLLANPVMEDWTYELTNLPTIISKDS